MPYSADLKSRRSKSDLQVSMFQIPEAMRAGLIQVSGLSAATGSKKSINTCILEALNAYFHADEDQLVEPKLPKLPLRHYTVRMNAYLKQQLMKTAAAWQIRLGIPITMNSVLNTAVYSYLQLHIPGFKLEP